ncbi:MAG: cytochrome C biogenesis protein, partial [Lachnospiraceae bacterium]|nr:cytochrome C biogenesis protein [Lachnospiraceae bacterium]
MGLTLDLNVPAITVLLQGFISFFSPCVLPLLPLYIGYLSGGTGKWKEGKVLRHTIFFVLGISATFFILGLGVSALGTFFQEKQALFARIGGAIVFLFGIYQLGAFGNSNLLSKERRLPFHMER